MAPMAAYGDTDFDAANPRGKTEIITKKINNALPPLEFRIFWNQRKDPSVDWPAPHGEIGRLEIKGKNPDKHIQSIANPGRTYSIFFEDYNFDGYMDFRLTDSGMILGNIFSDVYLFETYTNTYVRHQALSELTSISVDSEKKRIISDNRSAGGAAFTYRIFTFAEGRLRILLNRRSEVGLKAGQTYLLITETGFDPNGREAYKRSKKVKEDELTDEHFPLQTIPLDRLP